MIQQFPIIGKWYKVIKGAHKDFVGECVSFDLDNELPVILEDMEFNGCAVKLNEIKTHIKQMKNLDLIPNRLKN